MEYFIYFLRCEDNSIYIGTSNDVDKRYEAHKKGKGAKYTKAHPVKKIECILRCDNKREALQLEAFFKTWSKAKKEFFLKSPSIKLGNLLYQKKMGKLQEKKIKQKNV